MVSGNRASDDAPFGDLNLSAVVLMTSIELPDDDLGP